MRDKFEMRRDKHEIESSSLLKNSNRKLEANRRGRPDKERRGKQRNAKSFLLERMKLSIFPLRFLACFAVRFSAASQSKTSTVSRSMVWTCLGFRSSYFGFGQRRAGLLKRQQKFLPPQPAAVSAKVAILVDHAVAWDHDRNPVEPIRPANCPA